MERLANVRAVPMRDRWMLIFRIAVLLIIPVLIAEVIAALYAGALVGAWAVVATTLAIPAVLWWAVAAYVDGRLRNLQGLWDAQVNAAATKLDRVDYFYVGNRGAIVVDAERALVSVCVDPERGAFTFPFSAVRSYEIYKPGVTTHKINDVRASLSTTVNNFTDNMQAIDAQIDGTGLFLSLDDLDHPKVFVQMSYSDAESWFALMRRLSERTLATSAMPTLFPAPTNTASLWSPARGSGSRVVGIIGVVLLAAVASVALLNQVAERRVRQAEHQSQAEKSVTMAPGADAAAHDRAGTKTNATATRFLDGSQDLALNKFAAALHDASAVPLNSLTLPMLYEAKSGAKIDYTVVVRMGKFNLDAGLAATARRLDNPPSEAERMDAVKELLGPLQETFKSVESAESYLVPARVISTPSGSAWALRSAVPGFEGGIYCSGGAYELRIGGPIQQACVGMATSETILPRVGLNERLRRGELVFLKLRLTGAFAQAPSGLGDASTTGVEFGKGNGRSAVGRIAPSRMEAAYAFDPKTGAVAALN